ncbi:hypothetical protein KP509_34G073200 [Ceratopteris richardii]|uniref:Transmembrane protein n=1 Tax=Ceratopteris richardii TaxID=49495 RepID=A0A8T2QN53_CERRI|nr:hypothetical protein KP509_34G073200 [Ceratopteris richardii]
MGSLVRLVQAILHRPTIQLTTVLMLTPAACTITMFYCFDICSSHLLRFLQHIPVELMTRSCMFLAFSIAILLIMTLSIASGPEKQRRLPPRSLFELPFCPVPVANFAAYNGNLSAPSRDEAAFCTPRSEGARLRRTASQPVLSHTISPRTPSHMPCGPPSFPSAAQLTRSSSHTSMNKLHHSAPMTTVDDVLLTDEETDRRFSSFIESRFAMMRKELSD